MTRTWRALVLGGGGAKGEFELGVAEFLAEQGCGFEFFSGVSVGALNSSVLAQHASLADGVARLRSLWDSIRADSDIYSKPFPGGAIGTGLGALFSLFSSSGIARDSIHSSAPLRRLIEQHVTWEALQRSGKMWSVGVTSLTDGTYYLVSNDARLMPAARAEGARLTLTLDPGREGSIPDHVVDFILASSSMPVLFPPVDIYGHRFVDGGLRDITPLSSAFKAAKLHQETNQDRVIVVVSTSPAVIGARGADELDSGQEIAGRTIDIMAHEILANDLKCAGQRNNQPGYLKADVISIRPDFEPTLGTLEFGDPGKRAELRRHGRDMAQKAFREGQLAKLSEKSDSGRSA
ncbi:MAG TPA: patatin-like phospholipase family protein [Planctomycetota bacterium]|nr:patatin-like phospholipase family protein [Planctomycetota bacterium]